MAEVDDVELQAMQVIIQTLKLLEPDARERVLRYLIERFKQQGEIK